MKALSYAPSAQSDIDAIWDYSAEHWGADQANRYVRDIRVTCHALAMGTRRGRVSNIRFGYLKCPIGSHVIWFRDHGDRLQIMRILHAAQDVERHLHD
jgi:toxin ParE1/3/4